MEKELRKGASLIFASEEHQLEAEFRNTSSWRGGFLIWFNGTYVHHSKTFKSFERKLNQLIAEYSLVQA